jgi:hypothetical protein
MISSANAQRRWIIDAANGPGTDFTDLPPGVAAAADGDTLLVRAGNYTEFSTSKGIAVLGVPGQTRIATTLLNPGIDVFGLASGKTFRARGLVITGSLAQRISVQNSAGHVHFEEIDLASTGSGIAVLGVVGIIQCRLVTLVGCGRQSASFMVSALASRVAIARCRLSGWSALGDPFPNTRSARAALSLGQGAIVDLADCSITGGAGAAMLPFTGQYLPSAPAVLMADSTLRVRAGTARTLSAGVGASPTLPISAIMGTGTAQVDSRITLNSYAGAPPIEASVQATIGLVPGLSITGGTLGANLTARHEGQASQLCILAAGLVGAVQSLPFGDLVLDVATMQVLPVVFADGAGIAIWTVPVPVNGSLVGATLTWQVGSVANGLMLSNPVAVVLR